MASRLRGAAQVLFSRRPIWSLGDQMIVSGANFLTMVILARQLGLRDFGIFTLYWTSVLFLAVLHSSLIILPMVVLRAQYRNTARDRYDAIVAGLHFGFVALTLAALMPFIAAAISLGLIDATVVLPLLAYVACSLVHEYLRRFIFLDDRYFALTVSDLVRYTLQIGALLILGLQGRLTIAVSFWVLAGCALVGCLICVRFLPRPAFARDESRGIAARHWSSSKWLLSSSLLAWLSTNSLMYLIGAFAGAAAVGGMRACENLAGIMSIPLQGLYNVVPSEASATFAQSGRAGLRSYLSRVGIGVLIAGSAATVAIAVAPDQWLAIVYGEEFSGYGFLLVGYGLAFIAALVELPISAGLRTLETTRPVFLGNAWATAFTVGAGLLLVPPFGVGGAIVVILAAWGARLLIAYRSLVLALGNTD